LSAGTASLRIHHVDEDVGSTGKGFQVCARCGIAAYCSRECQSKDWKDRHKEYCKILSKSDPGKALSSTDADKRRMGRIKPEACDFVEPVRVAKGRIVSPAPKVISRLLRSYSDESKLIKQMVNAPSYWEVAQLSTVEQAEEMDIGFYDFLSSLRTPERVEGCCEIPLLEWFASRGHNLARHRKDTGWGLLHDLATTTHEHHAKAVPAVRWLVRHGVDVNQVSSRNHQGITTLATPLHLAVSVRSPDLITALIDCGADVNRCNKAGKTPLLFAPGPDPDEEGAEHKPFGNTTRSPIHTVEIFDLLVAHGADEFAVTRPQSKKDEHAGETLADIAYNRAQLLWCHEHNIKSRDGHPVIFDGWTRVQIHSLTNATHRNGQHGTVLRYNRESSRYEVTMDDTSQIALKLENLRFEPNPFVSAEQTSQHAVPEQDQEQVQQNVASTRAAASRSSSSLPDLM
jgi:hypothetical protein